MWVSRQLVLGLPTCHLDARLTDLIWYAQKVPIRRTRQPSELLR